jgi:hypothetical protein
MSAPPPPPPPPPPPAKAGTIAPPTTNVLGFDVLISQKAKLVCGLFHGRLCFHVYPASCLLMVTRFLRLSTCPCLHRRLVPIRSTMSRLRASLHPCSTTGRWSFVSARSRYLQLYSFIYDFFRLQLGLLLTIDIRSKAEYDQYVAVRYLRCVCNMCNMSCHS